MKSEKDLRTTACPNCGAKLDTQGIARGTTIVCAACRFTFVWQPAGDTRKFSRKAIASLLLGLAAAIFSCLAAVPGVILGVMALVEISRRDEELRGRTTAVIGIAASILLGTLGAAIVWALLLPALQMFSNLG